MATAPITPTAVPAFPALSNRTTYNALAYAWANFMGSTFQSELTSIADTTYDNTVEAAAAALTASTAATNAGISEQNAAASAGAAMWVSGTTYALGDAVWSPVDRLVYRRIVAGAGTTDPSADGTNWARLGTVGMAVFVVSGTTQTAAINNHYVLTNVAATTVTLPASPQSGDVVWITVANNLASNVIARNGKTIMGVAEDMTIDSRYVTVELKYVNNSWRFV
jgi:hypothetical protein